MHDLIGKMQQCVFIHRTAMRHGHVCPPKCSHQRDKIRPKEPQRLGDPDTEEQGDALGNVHGDTVRRVVIGDRGIQATCTRNHVSTHAHAAE